MRVLLAIAPYDICEFYPSYQSRSVRLFKAKGLVPGVTPPLGLLYLSATLKQHGIEVKLFDGAYHDTGDLFQLLNSFKPNLVGFSSTAPLWRRTLELTRIVKEKYKLPVVVGGANINTAGVNLIANEPSIDFAVQGDAELVLLGLCKELMRHKKEFKTKGLAWKKHNKLIKNPPVPFYVANLDLIPLPDRLAINHLDYCPSIGFYRALPNTSMVTTRGCLHSCFFCHDANSKLRARSVENVIEEFKLIKQMGIKDVILYDQDFGQERDRAIKICDALIKERIKLWIGCNLSIESFDLTLIRKMRKAGFWRVFYGIESACARNFNKLDKELSVKRIRRVLRLTEANGLQAFGSFIFGFPGDTKNDILEVIEFAKSLPLSYAKFVALSPWPGKDIYNHPEKYGQMVSTCDVDMSMNMVNFVPHEMTKAEMEGLLQLAYREFYMRPRYVLKRLLQMRTIEDFKQNLRGFLAFWRA